VSHVDFERPPPTDYDRRPVKPPPDRVTPWWVAALVAIVAIVAVAVVLISRGQGDQQTAAYNQGAAQGAAQATATDATQRAENAAAQANNAANAANASAVNAQNQAALHNAQVEDNPVQQPQVPAGVNSAAPPGVVSNASPSASPQ
jgi:uncharacterized protein HemX